MLSQIKIDNFSSTPKYQQIFNSVVRGIEEGRIKAGDKLPSIPEICVAHDVAKRTVEQAYQQLKRKGIVVSTRGKGHYVKETAYRQKQRIFLLFNKLSRHKKIIYDAFVGTLGEDVAVDFYVYHNNFRIFQDLIQHHPQVYSHYVIITHFNSELHKARDIINQLPKDKLIILDKLVEGITGQYAAVYQNFEQNIYDALESLRESIFKYRQLNIIFPHDTYHSRDILKGFQNFCVENAFPGRIIPNIEQETVQSGEVYINLVEEDLVTLIKKTKEAGLVVGEEVGIISYNENPLKEILLDGITVISTDFEQLGKTAAELILKKSKAHIENPFRVIVRKSL